MEDSIKNAEELVHMTNSALAQMKYNMPFDDLFKDFSANSSIFLEKLRHNRRRKKDTILPIQEGLEKLEGEVRADTNDILSSMDDLLDPEQYLSARQRTNQPQIIEKIHEINRKIEKKRQEIAKSEASKNETPKPKLKPKFPFENEIPKEETISKPEILPKKQISTPNLAESDKSSQVSLNRTFTISKPKKSAVNEDLKKNILQAEEVVDRGFKTARQLKQKLDFLTKADRKASSCEKISLSSKSLEHVSPRSVVSAETVKSLDVKKSRNAAEAKETRKKKRREKHRENVSVFDVKYTECRKHLGKKLKLQRLPSLQIGNGLRLQKIPSIDIPPQEVVETPVVTNAVVKNIVYGEDKIQKENLITDNVLSQKLGGRFVECTHCGKGVKVYDNKIDPDDVDDLLLKCDFDVFDPRIDDFVEKEFLGKHKCAEKVLVKESVVGEPKKEKKKEKKKIEKVQEENKKDSNQNAIEHKTDVHKQCIKLSDLSEYISRRYKEKTMKIESDFLEFEGILRDIFKKVDESREVFEGTQYLSILEREKNMKRLSATKPVVVALENPDSVPAPAQISKENVPVRTLEDIKFVNNISKEKNATEVVKLNNEKKIEQKGKYEKFKRLEEIRRKSIPSPKSSSGSDDPNRPLMKFVPGSRSIFPNVSNKNLESKRVESPTKLTPKEKLPETIEIGKVNRPLSENSDSETSSSSDKALKVEENSKQSSKNNDVKTDEDYQSDFEVESIENSIELPLELESNTQIIEFPSMEDRDRESNRYVNRLPTISEKDSEMEKKISSSSVSESELTSEKVSEKVESLAKEIEKIGEIAVNNEKKTEDFLKSSTFQQVKTDEILPSPKLHENLISPKAFIGISSKEKPENKPVHPDPDFTKFEKKVDEGLQKALDKAFENGVSYMLKRQQDIIDFNYKATRRKNIPKRNKHFKKPEIELLSNSSGSDIGMQNDFDRSSYQKEKNKTESCKKSTARSQLSPKSDLVSSTDQNTHANLAKNNQELTITSDNTSKEMVNSLKELLDVLKAQFAKTEILTDKLTENNKEKKDQKEEKVENLKTGIILSSLNPLENSKYVNSIIFSNLQRSRKDLASSSKKKSRNIYTQCIEQENSQDIISRSKFLNLSPKNLDAMQLGLPVAEKVIRKSIEKTSPSGISNFSYSSRDDRSLSAGEVLGTKSSNDPILSFRKRKEKPSSSENSSVSESNSLQIRKSSRPPKNKYGGERHSPKLSPKALCDDNSISEGEVPSCGLVDKYDSSQSIGEVISEQISAESLDEVTFK